MISIEVREDNVKEQVGNKTATNCVSHLASIHTAQNHCPKGVVVLRIGLRSAGKAFEAVGRHWQPENAGFGTLGKSTVRLQRKKSPFLILGPDKGDLIQNGPLLRQNY